MADAERFELELPPDLAQFIHSQVGTGAFASDGEVVKEALRAMKRQTDQLSELRARMAASIDDPRPPMTDEAAREHFRRRAKEILARQEHA